MKQVMAYGTPLGVGSGSHSGAGTSSLATSGRSGDSKPTGRASWRNSLGMEFVKVPAGTFVMGSPDDEEGREVGEHQHQVRISHGFWMGKYEVTQGEWEGVMETNPSDFSYLGPRFPVDNVSWNDAEEFIWRLNERESERGYRYRLPTETEWEYAVRAGTTGARYGELDEIAWYEGNSGLDPHPVGQKRANPWGLHDMLGNLWEWTADWYGEYPTGSVTDPTGPDWGSFKVFRGGSWHYPGSGVRSATRACYSTHCGIRLIGIRLVRTG